MKEAMLYERMDKNKVHCFLCAHQCRIAESHYGICNVRQNISGVLYTHAYGSVIADNVDPIEKKPLYHFLPGTLSYSIATMGCNFRCGFCQNWQISQVTENELPQRWATAMKPETVVENAVRQQCKSISYTYTEPTIYFEYAFECAKLAKERGLRNVFVSNGYMTDRCLEKIQPYLDACNIDLKSFTEDFYRKNCKAHLEPVLHSLRRIKEMGIWLEITTLIIPGENDSEEELKKIAEFIAALGSNTPWHVSRFYPQYEFTSQRATPAGIVLKAKEIGNRSGLHYVYPGNIPGTVDTRCLQCNALLIQRDGYSVKIEELSDGICRVCNTPVSGIW